MARERPPRPTQTTRAAYHFARRYANIETPLDCPAGRSAITSWQSLLDDADLGLLLGGQHAAEGLVQVFVGGFDVLLAGGVLGFLIVGQTQGLDRSLIFRLNLRWRLGSVPQRFDSLGA